MKIHEYQGKQVLRKYGVPVPEGRVAFSDDEAVQAYKGLGGGVCAVKSQIHAGGRGKGNLYNPDDTTQLIMEGGVKIARDETEVREFTRNIFGNLLITHQTGEQGRRVRRILIEKGCNIDREFYAGIVLDRECAMDVFMVSTEGGVEIEKVAAETPEKIVKVRIDPGTGLRPFQASQLAFALGLAGQQQKSAVKFFLKLYQAYRDTDASLAEINPLVITKEGDVIALDAKINFDDNALFRHADIMEYRDLEEEEPAEIEASKYNLNYIKLDGNVGCMVNGAGLAMATMDLIKLAGGEPANFLDVGGAASAETVRNGFRIILTDPNVKAILINIFGGIVRCDRVAEGVVEAVEALGGLKVPVIIRLAGTNHKEAGEILKASGLNFLVASDFQDAAKKVTVAVQ
ncbi:succinate--CoA ligase subunit beta [candidate division LCP-89 bacterium B3_LCP]|uniref:Succinate--CoA ligase [ADP-forming] subunit beta n=1 Tax=candidate division LCP-89 bacterium B3_LCP TaxID=2012998 RepID=A0A532V5L7_UNCL8|nr:MAG: succinate--CoA ligase subunit beta [candidate division LCP-89 bacterium B3_LCP]